MSEPRKNDWVVGSIVCGKSKKFTIISRLKEARHTLKHEFPFILENGDYCKHVSLWKPKDGDWVIPDSGISDDTFIVYKYEEKGFLIPNRCQPFLGQLPKNLK